MEKKRKDIQRFFKLFVGRHEREAAPSTPAQTIKGRKGRKKWVRPLVILLTTGVAVATAMAFRGMKAKAATAQAQSYNTASAERRGTSSELSSSRTLKARDTYSITSMAEGEVLSTSFKEGDQVERSQVFYEIDKSSMESQLTGSVNSLSRPQFSYEDALEDYNDALGDYSENTCKATDTGHIKEPYINAGDKVGGNTKLADVYSNGVMEIRIPFLSGEVAMIGIGMPIAVTLADTGEQMAGIVKAVVSQGTVLTDGRLIRVATIQTRSPGGLATSLRAAVQIGEFVGSEGGVLEASMNTTMNADLSTSMEVESLLVNTGGYVTKGTPASKMIGKSADELIQSYKDALDKAEESMESAQDKLDSTQDSYDDYTIKVPTFDQAITKSFKVGGNIARNSSSTTMLVIIYDLFSLAFEMPIGKLDIKRVRIGQKVEVSADAFEGRTFLDTVTNVGLESTYFNGVSVYPVTAILDNMGDLLPDMNVDGVIILEEVNDVLAIPVDALIRESQVYVKGSTVMEQQGPVPTGFRSVKVETGLTSGTYVGIANSSSKGDVVHAAESSKNSSSFTMMMDGGVGGPPGGGGSIGEQNRGGSGDHQNR